MASRRLAFPVAGLIPLLPLVLSLSQPFAVGAAGLAFVGGVLARDLAP